MDNKDSEVQNLLFIWIGAEVELKQAADEYARRHAYMLEARTLLSKREERSRDARNALDEYVHRTVGDVIGVPKQADAA